MWDTVTCSYEGFTGKRSLRKTAQIFSDLRSFFFKILKMDTHFI